MTSNTATTVTFLLLKSLYILSVFYFEFPLLLTHNLQLSLLLTVFNHSIALFLHSKWRHFNLNKANRDLIGFGLLSWFLVGIAGANPFNWNSLAFSLFLSSVSFNLLTLQPFKDTSLLTNLSNLNILNLSKDPLKMTLLFASLGSLIGSLLTGLAVILDWDVEWKRFPIPNMVGCIFGESCGIIVSLILNGLIVLKKFK